MSGFRGGSRNRTAENQTCNESVFSRMGSRPTPRARFAVLRPPGLTTPAPSRENTDEPAHWHLDAPLRRGLPRRHDAPVHGGARRLPPVDNGLLAIRPAPQRSPALGRNHPAVTERLAGNRGRHVGVFRHLMRSMGPQARGQRARKGGRIQRQTVGQRGPRRAPSETQRKPKRNPNETQRKPKRNPNESPRACVTITITITITTRDRTSLRRCIGWSTFGRFAFGSTQRASGR